MGQMWAAYVTEVDVAPDRLNPPTFAPNFGFPTPRKPREMIATQEEMEAAQLPLKKRDFCAHLLLDYLKCYKESMPFVQRYCRPAKHTYLTCEYEDFVLRMKEYERERRLLKREKRIKAKLRQADLEALSDE